MSKILISLAILFSYHAALAEDGPNYLVIRVPAKNDNARSVDVIPVAENLPELNESTADIIAQAADHDCTKLQDEAEAAYRRIARRVERADIRRIRAAACSFDTSCATERWRYNKILGRFNVSADGVCAPTQNRGLHAYFPSLPHSGQYPGLSVPYFSAWYQGRFNPYTWFSYVYFARGYWYYYYLAPWMI